MSGCKPPIMSRGTSPHPDWYYPLYEMIFAPTRRYTGEAALINSLVSLRNKVIEEIGCGTGNHVASFLAYDPAQIVGLDIDPEAVQLARDRFAQEPRVQVVHADGFTRSGPVDIVVAFFSLLQQARDSKTVVDRLQHVASRVARFRATAFIEFLNIRQYQKDFPAGTHTEIFRQGADVVTISPEYGPYMSLKYDCVLAGRETQYTVEIWPLDLNEVRTIAHSLQLSFGIVPMGGTDRRRWLLELGTPIEPSSGGH